MSTLTYAAVIFFAVFSADLAVQGTTQMASDFVFDLFNNYLWQPPVEQTNEPKPLDMLADLLIEPGF